MTTGIIQIDDKKSIAFRIFDGKRYRNSECKAFANQYFDVICCIAQFNDLVVYHMTLPQGIERKNIISALLHELEYVLPINFAEIVWGYHADGGNKFSVYVLRKEKFTDIIDLLKKQRLQCDILYPVQNLTSSVTMDFNNFVSVSMNVPKNNRPARNKLLKTFYWLFLIASIVLLIKIQIDKFQVFCQENRKISSIIDQHTRIYRTVQQEFSKLSAEKKLLKKMNELKFNLQSVFPLMQELSRMLPSHMWITNYAQHGDIIDLTIESSKDEPNFFRHLSGAKNFQIISLRKSRGGNSTIIFYVKLKGDHK